MVGGLVQQQQIRLSCQSAAKGHAPLFAARERPDERVQRRGVQSRSGGVDARLQFPTVRAFDLVQQAGQFGFGALAGFVTTKPRHQSRPRPPRCFAGR